ncbi:MAG: hypothetical protein JNL98_03010 [Bryobacterales bacterium]|nr:hypothetical protein [Bryobacterales bacterium]
MQEILERLVAANIQLLPLTQIEHHWVFEREGFISLVERTKDGGFGGIGSAGLWTEKGMAVLTLRGDRHYFIAKGFEQEASAEQVILLRKFATDLTSALKPGTL